MSTINWEADVSALQHLRAPAATAPKPPAASAITRVTLRAKVRRYGLA